MDTALLVSALATLLVTIDPPGLAPIFLSLTSGMDRNQRRQVGLRATITGIAVLLVFAFFGAGLLDALGISLNSFRIAGGLLLFAIAFEMIFEKRQQRQESTANTAVTQDDIRNIAAFPLATPLIAGPGAISATVLLSGEFSGAVGMAALCAMLVACGLILAAVFLAAESLDRFLGVTGRALLTRLLGVLLAALSVQYVVDGIRGAMAATVS
ncbi:MAG: MarC family protein [Pseudomonadota bacterium]